MRKAILLLLAALFLFPCAAPALDTVERHAPSGSFDVVWFEAGGDDPALVFVHGLACDHTAWRHQTPFFAAKHRTLAIDLPGHGTSEVLDAPYTQELFAEAVVAMLDAASVDRAVLVGHSMGAEVCRVVAERHPEKVRALVAVDGAFLFPPADSATRDKLQAEYTNIAALFGSASHDENMRAFVNGMLIPETSATTRSTFLDMMTGTSPLVVRRIMDDFTRIDRWEHRKALDVPVFALVADSSAAQEPGLKEKLATLFANLRYEEAASTDHFLMFEKPDEMNARIEAFLQNLP